MEWISTVNIFVNSNCLNTKLMCNLPPPTDLHNRDPSNAAGPGTTEAAKLWHAHRGAVPS